MNMSQQAVANAVKVSQRSYAYYESGLRVADYETLMRLADYFGVTIDYMLGRKTPGLSESRQALIDKAQSLSDEAVEALLSVANRLK